MMRTSFQDGSIPGGSEGIIERGRIGRAARRPDTGGGRRFGRWPLILLLAACGLIGGRPAPSLAAEPGSDRDAATSPGEELARRVQALEELVADLRAEIARLSGSGADSAAVEELERRIEALTLDIERLRIGKAAMPGAAGSIHGFGPAASKVYAVERGVAVGGYGEMLYQGFEEERDNGAASDKTDTLDLLRAVMYFGYKFNDRFLFNSEIEFEHAITGEGAEGEVAVEFAYVDFKASDAFGARGGLLLIPAGFLNELHEPPIFHGSRRPDVERFIIPTTWRENGAGVYGDLGPLAYKAYLVASLDGFEFSPADGIRGGRQGGSESKAEDFAVTARLDWTPVPGLLVGGSMFSGGVGQGRAGLENAALTQWDAHAEWNWRGLHLRGLYAKNIVSDAAAIGLAIDDDEVLPPGTTVIGERQIGWYGEVAWDILSPFGDTEQQLSPFVRYESFNTQDQVAAGLMADPANDRLVRTFGLTYRPIPNVAIKADLQNLSNGAGTAIDQVNMALGYLF
jgi:hypothetical protein